MLEEQVRRWTRAKNVDKLMISVTLGFWTQWLTELNTLHLNKTKHTRTDQIRANRPMSFDHHRSDNMCCKPKIDARQADAANTVHRIWVSPRNINIGCHLCFLRHFSLAVLFCSGCVVRLMKPFFPLCIAKLQIWICFLPAEVPWTFFPFKSLSFV